MNKFSWFLMGLAYICFIIAALVWPISIGTVIYHWAILDVAFKSAVGAGFFMWLKTFAFIIPGFILAGLSIFTGTK